MVTSIAQNWLDENRHRAFPMDRSEWRKSVSPESGLDCVMLDATLFDPGASSEERLDVSSVSVSESMTTVSMRYAGKTFSVGLTGGDVHGEGSFDARAMLIDGAGEEKASVKLVFSSHAHILENVGTGEWELGCRVERARVIWMPCGTGVDGIRVNGSKGVIGVARQKTASGSVVLQDGYRTSPVISGGKVVVRVGTRFGIDPCGFDLDDGGTRDCSRPLLFFCGQNAINSGNVVIKGGRGISVSQGRTYTVNDRSSKCDGKKIPCIEIVAGQELLDICAT